MTYVMPEQAVDLDALGDEPVAGECAARCRGRAVDDRFSRSKHLIL